MGGTSGSTARRCRVVTPSARNRFDWMCVISSLMAATCTCVSPDNRAITAGPPPLKGTCSILTPARESNITPFKWVKLPTPE